MIDNSLEEYRSQIDFIDKKIVDLIIERLVVCKNVGEYKKKNNLKILNSDRENLIIKNLIDYKNSKNEDIKINDSLIKELWIFIMNYSKTIQI